MAAYILDAAGYIIGTSDDPGAPANSTQITPPDNSATPLQFVNGAWLIAQPENYFITLLAFYSRFTQSERLAIRAAQTRDFIVADFMMLVGAATYIDLAGDDTQNGVAYLVSISLLTTARAAAILGAQIADSERPA